MRPELKAAFCKITALVVVATWLCAFGGLRLLIDQINKRFMQPSVVAPLTKPDYANNPRYELVTDGSASATSQVSGKPVPVYRLRKDSEKSR